MQMRSSWKMEQEVSAAPWELRGLVVVSNDDEGLPGRPPGIKVMGEG